MTGVICYIAMCILTIARQAKSSTWFELLGFMLSRTRCVSYELTLAYTGQRCDACYLRIAVRWPPNFKLLVFSYTVNHSLKLISPNAKAKIHLYHLECST